MANIITLFWGPGSFSNASDDGNVRDAYFMRREDLVPIGVHGTMVAVDWDSRTADSSCLQACPVNVFQWYRTENNVPATEMANATSYGLAKMVRRIDSIGLTSRTRAGHECIWCMACVTVCPPKAVKVDQASMDFHITASEAIQ